MNKKALSPFMLIAFVLMIILGFYFLLFLPIPSLKPIKASVEYFIVIALWIIIQIGFVYFYFKLAGWSISLFKFYKEYVFGLSLKIKNFIKIHT